MIVKPKGQASGKPSAEKSDPAVVEQQEKPKKNLSWKERLATLPEEEAKIIRAKAAEASRRSKAKKKGTTPAQSLVDRLTTQMARIEEKHQALNAERLDIGERLEAAQMALTAEKETTDGTV